jgi:hypothetical protein
MMCENPVKWACPFRGCTALHETGSFAPLANEPTCQVVIIRLIGSRMSECVCCASVVAFIMAAITIQGRIHNLDVLNIA